MQTKGVPKCKEYARSIFGSSLNGADGLHHGDQNLKSRLSKGGAWLEKSPYTESMAWRMFCAFSSSSLLCQRALKAVEVEVTELGS